ncbi:uncharacterized protein AKAME5_001741500 [Lates japonicus]|uniref:Uncharacterized protein n=1 Tax=Lates japonicus TaxID=270547 RepID=A0AAD3N3F8_LATJO|nr:uncharacterized protein AKAME5_001741500 [Lates japonicus]
MHGLKRKEYADVGEVIDFIIHQLEGPGRLHGYRWMYNKCLKNGIRANKEDVRLILAALDPDASAIRCSRRLNRGYFIQAVEEFGGCPRIVRTDAGTENVVVRDIQTYLRRSDVDSRAVRFGYGSAGRRDEVT